MLLLWFSGLLQLQCYRTVIPEAVEAISMIIAIESAMASIGVPSGLPISHSVLLMGNVSHFIRYLKPSYTYFRKM